MPFRPIQWARQTVEGRQIEADGSSLKDFYAVQLPDPGESKVPVMLYSTPGLRRWAQVAPQPLMVGGNEITPQKGIHALLEIDNAVYGHRLFGLSAQYQFFEIATTTVSRRVDVLINNTNNESLRNVRNAAYDAAEQDAALNITISDDRPTPNTYTFQIPASWYNGNLTWDSRSEPVEGIALPDDTFRFQDPGIELISARMDELGQLYLDFRKPDPNNMGEFIPADLNDLKRSTDSLTATWTITVGRNPALTATTVSIATDDDGDLLETLVFRAETTQRTLPAGTGADYDPFGTPPSALYETPASEIQNFTDEPDQAVPVDSPRKMVTDGRRILFVSGDRPYMWDIKANAFLRVRFPAVTDLTTLADAQDQTWVDCAWIDGYFILASRHGQFFHSRLDSSDFDQLDFASAESNPDEIVALSVLNRRIYILGSRTIELWFNSGGADFAFSRDRSLAINVGCASRESVVSNESHIIFLGSNGVVYMMQGGDLRGISAENVSYDIDRSIQSKARAFVYTEEGHRFYILTLTFADDTRKTWGFDFATGLWHERGTTDVLCATRWASDSVTQQTLVGREGYDHVFSQKLDWGYIEEDDGTRASFNREAVSPVIFANLQRVQNYSFQIDIPTRSGGLDDDSILVDWSDDGLQTFSQPRTVSIAASPSGIPRKRINRLGQFRYGRNFRVRTNVQRRVDILGAYVETDVASD